MIDPADSESNFNMGCSLLLGAHPEQARGPLRAAAESARFRERAWLKLAALEEQFRRPKRTAVWLRRLVRERPDSLQARLHYAGVLLRLGKLDDAEEQTEAALTLAPRDPDALRLRGILLCRRRRFGEAATAFAAWSVATPENATAHLFEARALALSKDAPAAQRACRNAIALDPALLRPHLLLYRVAKRTANPQQCQQYLKNAVDLRPDSVSLRAELAELLMNRTQFKAAARLAQEVLARSPDCREASLVLAKCSIRLGELAKAQVLLDRLAESFPTWGEVAAARSDLAERRSRQAPSVPRAVVPPTKAATDRPGPSRGIPSGADASPSSAHEASPAGDPVLGALGSLPGEEQAEKPAAGGETGRNPTGGGPGPIPAPHVPGRRLAASETGKNPPGSAPRRKLAPRQDAAALAATQTGAPTEAGAPAQAPSGGRPADRPELDFDFATPVSPRTRPFRLSFVDHLFVVRALILRDLRVKYHDNPIGIVSELLRPTAAIIGHYYLFVLINKAMPGRVPVSVFVVAGFTVWFAFNYSALGAMSGGNWPGGATRIPGVTPFHLQIAKAGWSYLLNMVFCLAALMPLQLFGDGFSLPNLPMTVFIFSLSSLMGFSFGVIAEELGQLWPIFKIIEKLITWILFVTSGLYFSLSMTHPPFLAHIFWYNPILHLVEYERYAFDAAYPIGLVTLLYPSIMAFAMLLLGLYVMKCVRRMALD